MEIIKMTCVVNIVYLINSLMLMVSVSAISQVKRDEGLITQNIVGQKVAEGGIVSFVCPTSGAANTTWYEGIHDLPDRQRFMVFHTARGSVLRIEPVRQRDDKIFYCEASDGVDFDVDGAHLTVYPAGEVPDGYPHIEVNPRLKAVETDRTAVMRCATSGTPTPTVSWLKDYLPVTMGGRISMINNGDLQILFAEPSDEGRYECVAENAIGTIYSYPANLYVRARRIPPHFTMTPLPQVTVRPGNSVTLPCAADGSPVPYVSWLRGSEMLTEEDSVPLGHNDLHLEAVYESANYTCRAETALARAEITVEVVVEDRNVWF